MKLLHFSWTAVVWTATKTGELYPVRLLTQAASPLAISRCPTPAALSQSSMKLWELMSAPNYMPMDVYQELSMWCTRALDFWVQELWLLLSFRSVLERIKSFYFLIASVAAAIFIAAQNIASMYSLVLAISAIVMKGFVKRCVLLTDCCPGIFGNGSNFQKFFRKYRLIQVFLTNLWRQIFILHVLV